MGISVEGSSFNPLQVSVALRSPGPLLLQASPSLGDPLNPAQATIKLASIILLNVHGP